jgi:hypothetical protein
MKLCAGLLLLPVLFCSCVRQPERAGGKPAGAAVPPLALLQAGENPLWFELAEAGPRQIAFPDEAELSPFTPWPLARHIRFTLPLGDELILGVNRAGFLRFTLWDAAGLAAEKDGGSETSGTALYRAADAARWGPYTLAALFPFEGRAATLLYRDGFFTDTAAPLPAPRAFTLDPDFPEPRPLEIPAFEDFPATDGWDLDALHAGADGRWYYRGIRKSPGQPEIVYYRTRNLGFKGEALSPSAFQNSALPEPLSAAPPLLRSVLEAAFALGPGGGAAAVVSAGFPGPRHFTRGADSAGAGQEAELTGPNLAGFYREPAAARPGIALAVLPNGRGFFRMEAPAPAKEASAAPPVPAFSGTAAGTAALPPAPAGESPAVSAAAGPQPLTLPALPPGFAYTAAALCGNTLIAAWEEQEGYSIGAAGFMALRLPAE